MKTRYLIYIVVSVICIIAIMAGIYYQIIESNPKTVTEVSNISIVEEPIQEEKAEDLEAVKEEFNKLFSNSFNSQGYNVASIEKLKGLENKDVVYTVGNVTEEVQSKYMVSIKLPVINILGDITEEFNNITSRTFANKANQIITNSTEYTIYNTEYSAYLNENLLSVVIKSILKEGANPQRTIIQTYNYDIENKKSLTLNEVLSSRGYNLKEINSKIEKNIKEANNQAKAIATAVGQTLYERDLNNAMYITDNTNYFFIGPKNQIYIIYPYGNTNYTSEMDVIKI